MSKKYPYDEKRANEHPGNIEQITSKQVWYINHLSDGINDKGETLNDVMDSIPGDLDVEDLNKGQASFVIKCLLGEINPI